MPSKRGIFKILILADMDPSSLEEVFVLEKKIYRYLIKWPEAKDTTEGICLEWLGGEPNKENVAKALDQGEKKGWIIARTIQPGKKLYMLNPVKLREVQEFVDNT